jgi:hypothetical protein
MNYILENFLSKFYHLLLFLRMEDAKSRSRNLRNSKANVILPIILCIYPVCYLAVVNIISKKYLKEI